MSFNKVILIGNLTADPELKQTPSGVSVCRFTLAVGRNYSKEKETDFISCVAWRQTAEFINKWFTKGKPILVCGEVQTRSWEKDGVKHFATEVVASEATFVGGKDTQAEKPKEEPQFEEVDQGDSDLPF